MSKHYQYRSIYMPSEYRNEAVSTLISTARQLEDHDVVVDYSLDNYSPIALHGKERDYGSLAIKLVSQLEGSSAVLTFFSDQNKITTYNLDTGTNDWIVNKAYSPSIVNHADVLLALSRETDNTLFNNYLDKPDITQEEILGSIQDFVKLGFINSDSTHNNMSARTTRIYSSLNSLTPRKPLIPTEQENSTYDSRSKLVIESVRKPGGQAPLKTFHLSNISRNYDNPKSGYEVKHELSINTKTITDELLKKWLPYATHELEINTKVSVLATSEELEALALGAYYAQPNDTNFESVTERNQSAFFEALKLLLPS